MPAVRSFLTLSVMAACLAQVLANPTNHESYGDDKSYSDDTSDGGGGFGGFGGKGNGGGGGGGWQGNNESSTSEYVAPAEAPTTVVKAQDCAPPATSTITETSTITAVSACESNTVTAYVTQWMNAPPGCWCGTDTPPASSAWESGGAGAAVGAAAAFTTTGAITPGLSSIAASLAVVTGVTVAGSGSAAPPAPTVSPGGFFTESISSVATTSGTQSSGSVSVSSNEAQPTEASEAPEPEESAASSSSLSAATTISASTTTTTSSEEKNTIAATPSSESSPTEPSTSSTTTSSSASAEAEQGGFPAGSFQTVDSATLTLKNAYTLGIGRRAPLPTLLSP